jgi:hypothetical protein
MLNLLSGLKVYLMVGIFAFGFGVTVGYKTHEYFDLKDKEKAAEQVAEADEKGVEREKETKIVNTKQIKELKEYVKVNPTRPGLTDDELLRYNSRR